MDAGSRSSGKERTNLVERIYAALELEVRGVAVHGIGADAALSAARERVVTHGGRFSADTRAGSQRVLRAQFPIVAAGA